jgi:carboxyl-terminal processing protease
VKFSNKYIIPLLLGVAIAIGIFIGSRLNYNDKSTAFFNSNSKKDKLNRLIDYIDHEYVDEVNTDSIVDITVNRILDNLDPHSTYIPKDDAQQIAESMQGDFVGIGVSFYNYRDSVAVIRALDGGPSKRVGIKGGDRIIEANGIPIYGSSWTNETIVKHLKGQKGSKVELKIFRPSQNAFLDFTLSRDDVPLKSVDASYMLTPELGYININRFAETTYREFKTGLTNLMNQGATQLVLDLRDNPGGFLSIAEEIADEFLKDGKLILFTKNKKGLINKTFATAKGDFEEGEVFVLINENSASASEVIAGALQDNDKGTIIGRRSFGKGLVQREMALGDGSAVRLTVSRYYTPTGRSIQRSYDNGNQEYYHDYLSRKDNGELTSASQIKIADSLKFTTPKGKVVFGGGGIIPDEFVPLNEERDNEIVRRIVASGLINYFAFEYLDQNRTKFENFSEEDFINRFLVSDELLGEFSIYLEEKTRHAIPFSEYNSTIKLYLKAIIAEQLFGKNAYTKIVNTGDDFIARVLQLAKNSSVQ